MKRRKVSLKLLSFLAIFATNSASSKYHEFVENIDTDEPDYGNKSVADSFTEMGVEIVYIDSKPVIRSDNHGERMMGVPDDKCDNARVNLETDFDPKNETLLEMKTVCNEFKAFDPEIASPVLTLMTIPKRYVPIHRCMHIKINYMEPIPSIGPHRPLWARYGTYSYCPTQRWLHNVEHGAIVGLYHPCADPEQVSALKSTIRGCLYRHVLTPYPELTPERPIALVGWSASLEMSHFDISLAKFFMRTYAKTGPEKTFHDGQYRHLLIEKSELVTTMKDKVICPEQEKYD